MLSKDVKNKWIEALRSGKYNQTQETLKEKFEFDVFGYCCLGVLSEAVLGIKTPAYDSRENPDLVKDEGPTEIYDQIREVVPCRIVNLGIKMNDTGSTFSEIADMIEKEWKV